MKDELVVVSVKQIEGDVYGADVRCRFRFANRGQATTLLMGFPVELELHMEMVPETDLAVHGFTAAVDGQPITNGNRA